MNLKDCLKKISKKDATAIQQLVDSGMSETEAVLQQIGVVDGEIEKIAQTVDAYPVGTVAVDFDPEIQRYARGDVAGNVTIHRVSDNHVLHRLPNSGPGFELEFWDGLAFCPD